MRAHDEPTQQQAMEFVMGTLHRPAGTAHQSFLHFQQQLAVVAGAKPAATDGKLPQSRRSPVYSTFRNTPKQATISITTPELHTAEAEQPPSRRPSTASPPKTKPISLRVAPDILANLWSDFLRSYFDGAGKTVKEQNPTQPPRPRENDWKVSQTPEYVTGQGLPTATSLATSVLHKMHREKAADSPKVPVRRLTLPVDPVPAVRPVSPPAFRAAERKCSVEWPRTSVSPKKVDLEEVELFSRSIIETTASPIHPERAPSDRAPPTLIDTPIEPPAERRQSTVVPRASTLAVERDSPNASSAGGSPLLPLQNLRDQSEIPGSLVEPNCAGDGQVESDRSRTSSQKPPRPIRPQTAAVTKPFFPYEPPRLTEPMITGPVEPWSQPNSATTTRRRNEPHADDTTASKARKIRTFARTVTRRAPVSVPATDSPTTNNRRYALSSLHPSKRHR